MTYNKYDDKYTIPGAEDKVFYNEMKAVEEEIKEYFKCGVADKTLDTLYYECSSLPKAHAFLTEYPAGSRYIFNRIVETQVRYYIDRKTS